jgi:hypothetical protein
MRARAVERPPLTTVYNVAEADCGEMALGSREYPTAGG